MCVSGYCQPCVRLALVCLRKDFEAHVISILEDTTVKQAASVSRGCIQACMYRCVCNYCVCI